MMQGQKGAIGGSLPESLGFEHGSSSSDSGVVEQQVCWTNFRRNPPVDVNQEAQNLSMWSMGEASSSAVPNRVDPKVGHAWSSLMKAQPEVSQREPSAHASRLSLGDGNTNPTHTHANNGHNVSGKKPSNYASSSSGPSSSGIESSSIYQRPGGSNGVWQPVNENPTPTNTIYFDPIIPRLGSGIGGVSSDSRAIENIRRNVRIRINNSRQQEQLPASNSSNNNNGLLSFSSSHSSLGLNPVATTGDATSSHAVQPMVQVPGFTRNLHVPSRNRSSNSRATRPWPTNVVGGLGDNSRTTPTNIVDHPLFVQLNDIRNTAQNAVNLDLNSVGGNETNNGNGIASTSNPMPNLRPHRASSLLSSRRHTELLQRYLSSSIGSGAGGGDRGQSNNLFSRIPPPVNAAASSSQETGVPPVVAIAGHHPHRHRARTSDRQLDGVFGFPHLSRAVPGGSERRGRLVSEMRNVLDPLRRGEGLRFEDVMLLDQSVFFGMPDVHDRHRDMRLDIDNMSYEELLALEERIGNVNTGLTEENISKHLKQKTYASDAGQPDAEPCCICQDEYKNGDDLGALGCGHEFHTGCIKQWLLQKNACPVCKSAAAT
ncbi:hypothetical protein M8C21_027308 [Ambrosia artemisiifolia]|uniref:RING-type E3 ubiquitin transferase n=1 Tax=Ambrosia artemisiifolia TaxID=4212 RepID=A0AAD5GHY2_AMBAR|nr:hypothetical protein M8C21_027308 [Ambrosia artemisiifolia]